MNNKPYSIAIDGNEANVQSRVGTGEYAYKLLTHFAANKDDGLSFDIYLRDNPLSDMPPASDRWKYHVIGPWRGWTRLAFPYHLLTGPHHDVVWNPAHYLPPFTRSPAVVTIHDLAYEFYPELFLAGDLYKLQKWTRSSVERAARVIAVSEATMKDIVKLYKIPESKITVVHNGYDRVASPSASEAKKRISNWPLIPGQYILFVGTLQPRKNVVKLVQAFRLLKEKGYQGKLVIAGKIGWMGEETLAAIKSSPDASDIVMTGYIDEDTRNALYSNADVFVMPSLYEGFGLPVIEALAHGCPVASADNSSLPEVVGDAGELFDATDPADMARAIEAAHTHRVALIKKGKVQAAKFTWEKCAQETLHVLTSVK